jgi:hypothetical protein
MTKWDDFSHFIVNDLSFHGDVTLAHSYIVHLSFFEACLMFKNNVLNSILPTLIVIMEKHKQR